VRSILLQQQSGRDAVAMMFGCLLLQSSVSTIADQFLHRLLRCLDSILVVLDSLSASARRFSAVHRRMS